MTTRTYSTTLDNGSDAGFRAWGSELSSNLQAAGLVQTADTGQINWTTVTRPANNVIAGYEIYRFNDALQGTAPIFIRIEYGSGSFQQTMVLMKIQVGTGTNGAGTITGQASTLQTFVGTSAGFPTPSTTTPFPTFICVKSGFFGLVYKANAYGNGYAVGFVTVSRTCDSNGAFTTTGFQMLTGSQSLGSADRVLEQCVRTAATAATYAASRVKAVAPGALATSYFATTGNYQVYYDWMHVPDIMPSINTCTIIMQDLPLGTTFSATLFGSTAHTYISVGITGGNGEVTNTTAYGTAMIWE